MPINKRRLGNAWEQVAACHLRAEGMTVLETNYYTKIGEIDIIAKEGDTLVFLEVKYRATGKCGGADYAISAKKQQTIRRVAQWYMTEQKIPPNSFVRFDAVLITGEDYRHIRNAW